MKNNFIYLIYIKQFNAHTNEKEMINTNKAVVVSFDPFASSLQITNTASADIYVPFLVKEIHVRGIDLDFMTDFQPLYFTSSLFNNGPLGSGYAVYYVIQV